MNGLRYIGWALILVKGRGARVDQGAGLESLWLLWVGPRGFESRPRRLEREPWRERAGDGDSVMRPYARWVIETDPELADYARWALRRYRPSTVERDLRVLRRLRKEGVLDREETADFFTKGVLLLAGEWSVPTSGW